MQKNTFYFYDLETSGFKPRIARIMQFAGQRTDLDLNPIGEPDNILIRITPDVLPEPDAILVTGITPQSTLTDGITEAEFTKYLTSKVSVPGTIMVGYNNIRFDDEFLRFTLWRNFYDAYEWHWKDGCSRWDLLDVVRMTRALRPEGIEWPFAPDGQPSNRLEYLTAINKLEHANAHDALSDVSATIDMAKLIKTKQPKLFSHLLNIRNKDKVEDLVTSGSPFIYTSGRYPGEFEKTTVAVKVANYVNKGTVLVYDLRIDPDEFTNQGSKELAELMNKHGKDTPYFPVKKLSYNKCPAISGNLDIIGKDKATRARLKIDPEQINNNAKKLLKAKDFSQKLEEAARISQHHEQTKLVVSEQEVDSMLYDGFLPETDKTKMRAVRAADSNELGELQIEFSDERLETLLPLYKARNFPKALSQAEQEHWEKFREHKLLDGGQNSLAARYFKRLDELNRSAGADGQNQYLLEELNLYGQAIVPFS